MLALRRATVWHNASRYLNTTRALLSESLEGQPQDPPVQSEPEDSPAGPRNTARKIDALLQENNQYRFHVKCSRNNTVVTFTDAKGSVILCTSGGRLGFKGANRASYEAGYACVLRALQRVAQENETKKFALHVLLNGFGQGREAALRALLTNEAEDIRNIVTKFTDKTPITIGGTRPKKARRL